MAIQIPNPGTGNGASGDNEFVLWSKVKDNFSDQTNAASKLVGTGKGQIPLAEDVNKLAHISNATANTIGSNPDITSMAHIPAGGSHFIGGSSKYSDAPQSFSYANYIRFDGYGSSGFSILHGYGSQSPYLLYMRSRNTAEGWMKIYHDKNTTVDAGTGFLKVSSPVLHVYNDKIDKIHEAEQLDITVDKKGVGHYEIRGTTGLRQNDGWNMSPPRDIHGNVRCMIEVTEKDDVITVKTYKRKFDLELAAIVHDYDNPFDIPEGACVELRFNDLPYENIDDIQTEEVDLGK